MGRQPANQKEVMNKLLTRREVRQEIATYHRGNVESIQQAVTWLMLPWYVRAWERTKAWWDREVVWPPAEPRWWPDRLSWTEEEA